MSFNKSFENNFHNMIIYMMITFFFSSVNIFIVFIKCPHKNVNIANVRIKMIY